MQFASPAESVLTSPNVSVGQDSSLKTTLTWAVGIVIAMIGAFVLLRPSTEEIKQTQSIPKFKTNGQISCTSILKEASKMQAASEDQTPSLDALISAAQASAFVNLVANFGPPKVEGFNIPDMLNHVDSSLHALKTSLQK